MASAPTLLVRDLRKRYGAVEAVAGVGFAIQPGEVHGLLGPNGAGKTTTIEAIVGLIEHDGGEIVVCGLDAHNHRRAVRQRIGVAMQSTAFQDAITPREVIRTFAALYDVPDDPTALIERFGLAKPDVPYRHLSGGERQRLALALAFVNDPELVILDEPTAGLDPAMRREVHRHIHAIAAEGRAVLVATHDMDEAERLCDRVSVLHHGRLVGEGSWPELAAATGAAARVEAEFDRPLEADWAAALPGATDVIVNPDGVAFTTPDPDRALRDLLALCGARGIRITGVRAGRAALEQVLVALTAAERGR
jgi:ABC-2 type transport system ATP-binding protein